MNFAQPLSEATLVSAAVKVVLPWSMCPIVPTFTCGLLRSNFSLAMSSTSSRVLLDYVMPRRPPSPFGLRWTTFAQILVACQPKLAKRAKVGADVQDRTGDLVLTKDALCQLSYIGLRASADESAA